VFIFGKREYLQLEWREGGTKLIALDTWLVEPDGLTPVWDMSRANGALTYNTNPQLHARVIQQAREAEMADRWVRVSVLCHYIDARETDVETRLSMITRKRRDGPQYDMGKLPDIL
jgi:hypothetical protein